MATEIERARSEPGGEAHPVQREAESARETALDALRVRHRDDEGRPLPGPAVTPSEAPLTPRSTTARPLAPAPLAGATHALLRIGFGLLFMQHGAQKLFGLFGGVDGAGATVPLLSQFGLAGVLEFFGGALIVLGLLTRPVALLLLLEMIVAYVQVHVPQGGLPIENGGELALLYALGFAFLAGNGPGPWSFDRRLLPRLY